LKVVIVLGGDPPATVLLDWRMRTADFSIAADAGMNAFAEAGLEPDLLIGDMDSFNPDEADLVCEIQRITDQGTTDFEKALGCPEARQADEIVVLGGTGGRSDHFLNNLLLAAGLPQSQNVLFEGECEILYRVTTERPLALEGLAGQSISFTPVVVCEGVTVTGVRWPLTEASMGPGRQLSQSNVVEAQDLRVSLATGILYAVVPKR
jgi:thiamine pyrophosphokinase